MTWLAGLQKPFDTNSFINGCDFKPAENIKRAAPVFHSRNARARRSLFPEHMHTFGIESHTTSNPSRTSYITCYILNCTLYPRHPQTLGPSSPRKGRKSLARAYGRWCPTPRANGKDERCWATMDLRSECRCALCTRNTIPCIGSFIVTWIKPLYH